MSEPVRSQFSFPLSSGIAILTVPIPMTEEDFDCMIKILETFKSGMVRKPRIISLDLETGDMKELIAAAVDHDDPKRVLREFMAARPELFGERKDK